MELRKHQIEALAAIDKYDEGIIHLPTATGKTIEIKDAEGLLILSDRCWCDSRLYVALCQSVYRCRCKGQFCYCFF